MPIFVSYSHQDKDFAERLCQNLVGKRLNLWMDRWELKPGDSLIESVQDALENSGAILMILSESYIKSDWCKKELNAVLIRELEGHGNIIIPIRLDDIEWPIFLREKVYADFRTEWDEPFGILMESLYKYVNTEQDRIEMPEFHVDYASSAIRGPSDDLIVGYQYIFCEHSEKLPYSVLSTIIVGMTDSYSLEYNKMVATQGEDSARGVISNVLLDFFKDNKITVELTDANPHYLSVDINGPNGTGMLVLNIEVRWLGEDTGKTLIYWADKAMSNALQSYLRKVRSD